MGYLFEYGLAAAHTSETSNAEELLKSVNPQLDGNCQCIINALAADTAFTSGDPVSIWPTASGWLADDVVDNADQYIGVVQDTPSSAGDDVRVCMGGFTYINYVGSTKLATAYGSVIELSCHALSATGACTTPTTNSFGWPVTSGTQGTGDTRMIFIDRPWKVVDDTTP
jgi:hypothetical protein